MEGLMTAVHTAQRDYYIDYAKGVAVFFMAWGHTMYFTQWLPHQSLHYALLWAITELSMPIFVLASGINVVNQVERMKSDVSARPSIAFLGSIAWLFLLGFVYCINRRSLGLMDLFHTVAMGTALAYIVTRRQWPTWAIAAVAFGIFSVGAVLSVDAIPVGSDLLKNFDYSGFRHRPQNPFFADAVTYLTIGEIKRQAVLEYPLWRRLLHVHFALIPWSGYFLFGVLLKRIERTKWEYVLLGGTFILFVLTFFAFPRFVPLDDFGFFLRSKPDYTARHIISGPLMMILLARYYKQGVSKLAQAAELAGKESFLFFVCHWLVIWSSATFSNIFMHNISYWYVWAMQIPLNIYLAYKLTQLMAIWRDRSINKRYYIPLWFGIMIGGGFLALRADARGSLFAMKIFSFPASIAVAMVCPVGLNFIRALVYRKQIAAMKKAAKAKKAAEAA